MVQYKLNKLEVILERMKNEFSIATKDAKEIAKNQACYRLWLIVSILINVILLTCMMR